MGRILALDYGEKRIGVAISDQTQIIAQILENALVSGQQTFKAIKNLINKYEISLVLVGMPKSLSGNSNKSQKKVEDFIKELKTKIVIPVHTVDERFSTVEAQRMLNGQGLGRDAKKAFLDNTAAQLLLQQYLDAKRNADDSG